MIIPNEELDMQHLIAAIDLDLYYSAILQDNFNDNRDQEQQ
jgi:hypothetical protein